MYANAKRGYFQYQQNDVLGLSGVELVDRLFKAICSNITHAISAIKSGKTAEKGQKIGRAIAIIGELQASLNLKEGGEIAENLYALYDFLIRQLLLANLNNDIEQLESVIKILTPIMEGWSEITERSKGQIEASNSSRGDSNQLKQLHSAL